MGLASRQTVQLQQSAIGPGSANRGGIENHAHFVLVINPGVSGLILLRHNRFGPLAGWWICTDTTLFPRPQ